MSKSSGANDSSTKALRKLQAQGLAFTNDTFLSEIIGRDLEKVALFIEAGIDVNAAIDGTPPIVWLASTFLGNCEIAQLLIDNGADVNAVSETGISALRMAVFNGRKKELVQLLIANGVDVNAVDNKDGVTSIHMAVASGQRELVQLLIANGADVNAVGKGGLTAIGIAAFDDRKDLVQLLIANGADANPKSGSRNTMSEKQEITNIIERLELLEEKFGIAISGLYASCYYQPCGTPPYHVVKINFDVTSLSGGKLERSLRVSASAYNSAGQLLDTSSTFIDKEDFMGFGPMSILSLLDQAPAKIRLFPSV